MLSPSLGAPRGQWSVQCHVLCMCYAMCYACSPTWTRVCVMPCVMHVYPCGCGSVLCHVVMCILYMLPCCRVFAMWPSCHVFDGLRLSLECVLSCCHVLSSSQHVTCCDVVMSCHAVMCTCFDKAIFVPFSPYGSHHFHGEARL